MDNSHSNPTPLLSVSPLEEEGIVRRGPANATIVYKEWRHAGKLILRGTISDKKFAMATQKLFSHGLPTTPNSFKLERDATVLWLGPDEWLLITNCDQEAILKKKLEKALSGTHSALIDVSDNSTIIQISGENARRVIMKGCSVDVHPRVFGPGCCVQTNLAQANVIFWLEDEKPSYNILVRASFANYLWNWLLDAASEFSFRIEI
tara:strand:+ start:3126 stop:3743 length:618 start_codon:yes stop_codon:yes gene_type:complete